MKYKLLSCTAAFALGAGAAVADGHISLMVPIGEGGYNWESYETFAAEHDFAGEQLTVFGPWPMGIRPTPNQLNRIML